MAKLILRDLPTNSVATTGATEKKTTLLIGAEVDQNFVNLNAEVATKAPINNPTFTGSVIISSGIIDGVNIGVTAPGTGKFTTLEADSAVIASSVSAGSLVVTGSATAISFSGSHSGDGSGLTGLDASMLASGVVPSDKLVGTYSININGNATTVNNGIYSNQAYANPSWITSYGADKLVGTLSGDRGVSAGSGSSSFVAYNGFNATNGQFDGGTTIPTSTTRLNFGGYLYATRFYGVVYGSGANITSLNASQLTTGTVSPERLAGSYDISITGNASTSTSASTLSTTLAIESGGTGATTASAARTNLGATITGAKIFTAANPREVTNLLTRGAHNRETNGGTLVAGLHYAIWTSTGAISMNAPSYADSNNGDVILITNLDMSWSDTNKFTIVRQANTTIGNLTENIECTSGNGCMLVCVWKDGVNAAWNVIPL